MIIINPEEAKDRIDEILKEHATDWGLFEAEDWEPMRQALVDDLYKEIQDILDESDEDYEEEDG